MARNPISMSDTAFDSIYSKIEKSYPNACILFIDEIKNLKKFIINISQP
jgi:hypothetical protein